LLVCLSVVFLLRCFIIYVHCHFGSSWIHLAVIRNPSLLSLRRRGKLFVLRG
jgi:hypothetical protein